MPRTKTCIICWTPHTNTMSKTCSPKCERTHRANLAKANKEKIKVKKEKAKEKILIRLSWVEETDRNEIREIVTENIWPFVKSRQITIKVTRWKVKTDKQKLIKIADDLWSEAVKVNYWYKCAYSWESENLNSHHIESRSHFATRWDLDNWICLTSTHHTFSQEFSAHKTPAKFRDWLIDTKWEKYVNWLYSKSREIVKITPDFIKEKIQILKEFIAKNK